MARVLVSYYSKSGNTKKMADILAQAVKDAGADLIRQEAANTTNADLLGVDAIAIGSPDYFSYPAGQVKTIFDEALSIKAQLSNKPALCFSSHGGGGKIKKPFEDLMKAIGLKLAAPCILCHEAPAGVVVDEIRAAAKKLVDAIGE